MPDPDHRPSTPGTVTSIAIEPATASSDRHVGETPAPVRDLVRPRRS
jgi:hypothetical protein